jgi:predicted AAA+ superfamily ATPase
VVATGSHTRDRRRGDERLAGRRGGGAELDLEMLPLGFREYVGLLDPAALPDTTPGLDASDSHRLAALRPRLSALF